MPSKPRAVAPTLFPTWPPIPTRPAPRVGLFRLFPTEQNGGQWWGGGRWVLVGGPNLPILRPTGPLTGLFWPSVGGGPAEDGPTRPAGAKTATYDQAEGPSREQNGRAKGTKPAHCAPIWPSRGGGREQTGGRAGTKWAEPPHPKTQHCAHAPSLTARRGERLNGAHRRATGGQHSAERPTASLCRPSPALSGGRFLRRGGVDLGVFFFFCGPRPSPHTLHGKNFGKFFCQH